MKTEHKIELQWSYCLKSNVLLHKKEQGLQEQSFPLSYASSAHPSVHRVQQMLQDTMKMTALSSHQTCEAGECKPCFKQSQGGVGGEV